MYMGGSPTAAARRAERMRKYSTASSTHSTFSGEDGVRVQETRPREASVYVGGSPTPAARRAERMRKYSSASSSHSTFSGEDGMRVRRRDPE